MKVNDKYIFKIKLFNNHNLSYAFTNSIILVNSLFGFDNKFYGVSYSVI